MIILRNKWFFTLLWSFLLVSCSVSKKLQKEVESSSAEEDYFKGITVMNAETGELLIDFNANKFYTPASNVKIFTLYTAWRTLKDSVVSFDYVTVGDSLILRGAANPFFLTDSSGNGALDFLASKNEKIYLKDEEIEESVYGTGWSWDDYEYAYMPEKSLFPIYGNVVTIRKSGDQVTVKPDFFQDKIHQYDGVSTTRDKDANEFYIDRSVNYSVRKIPFITSNQMVADLLSHELNKKIVLLETDKEYDFKPYKDVVYDTLYSHMMVDSDNFIAEQLMLRVGSVTKGVYSVKEAIDYALENYMDDIPQKPRWVDGSGLSRYNLFSPQSMTYILKKMYDEIPHDQLFPYFPKGGVNGTLKNNYVGQPYIQAKSGSLSNNYALSGYLKTKKGEMLIFSYMNNHFAGSSTQRKKEMSVFLEKLYESY